MASPRTHIVTRYALAVLRGEIVAGRLLKLACERHIRDLRTGHERGLWFDCEAADSAFRFFRLTPHTKGRAAGKPFELQAWQAFSVGSVYGWKRVRDGAPVPRYATRAHMKSRDCVRRFTEVYEEVARKNGKSTKLSSVALRALAFEGESRAEVYSVATKKEQARIVFDEAKSMVRASRPLAAIYDDQEHRLTHPQSGSRFIALSKDAKTADGLNPYLTIVDELHAHKTREMVDVMESAAGARDNQIYWYITTAGASNQQHSICWEKRRYAVQVLEGALQNDHLFALIFAIDEGDDWTDEAVWPKANPNLGVSVDIETLRNECAKAIANPSAQAEFRRKRCNEWVETEDAWIPPMVWNRNPARLDLVAVEGRTPFGALDLSSTVDITAWTLCWPGETADEPWRYLSRYFVPEGRIAYRVKEDRLPYDVWAEKGRLIATPGDMVDYDTVLKQIVADSETYGVCTMAYDKWNAADIAAKLMNEGLDPVEFRQGIPSYAYPSKYFEALVHAGRVEWDGSPVTNWMVLSASLRRDANNNFMPDKGAAEQSKSKIDGLMTMIMATGLALREQEDGGETPWDADPEFKLVS